MRHFPGPGLCSPFVIQVVMLFPATGLGSCRVRGAVYKPAQSLHSAAGNGRTWRVLAIMYSVLKLVPLGLFFFPRYLIYRSVWERKHERAKPVASSSKKPNSVFPLQCGKFSKSNTVKNPRRFCRNTAYSSNYTIWLHLILQILIIPDNGLMFFLTLPVLHSCYTLSQWALGP